MKRATVAGLTREARHALSPSLSKTARRTYRRFLRMTPGDMPKWAAKRRLKAASER